MGLLRDLEKDGGLKKCAKVFILPVADQVESVSNGNMVTGEDIPTIWRIPIEDIPTIWRKPFEDIPTIWRIH